MPSREGPVPGLRPARTAGAGARDRHGGTEAGVGPLAGIHQRRLVLPAVPRAHEDVDRTTAAVRPRGADHRGRAGDGHPPTDLVAGAGRYREPSRCRCRGCPRRRQRDRDDACQQSRYGQPGPRCEPALSKPSPHRPSYRCKGCNSQVSNAWHRKNAQNDEYREAKNKRQAEWRAANKGEKLTRANKRYSLRQLYGITIEQYEAMLAAQNRRCAICPQPLEGRRAAHVDHDHKTGRIRGILCTSCNNGLGRFRDDPALLRRAARYLERSTVSTAVVAARLIGTPEEPGIADKG